MAAWIFIQTPFGQNWIARQVTKRLSKTLHTKVSVKHVDFSLLNRMHLEGLMIEDRQGDTILYAGDAKVRITDWFIFKKNAELKYFGLENALVKFQRTDSVWRQQFLFDILGGSSSGSGNKKKEGMRFNLKKVELKNVTFLKKDVWLGNDMTIRIGNLNMDARDINLSAKKADISYLSIDQPFVMIYNYKKQKPPSLTEVKISSTTIDTLLKWNSGEWLVHLDKLNLTNGIFKNEKQSEKPANTYFDGRHIEFNNINTELTNINWIKDTITAALSLNTKERSGLEVKKMEAAVKFSPQEMAFNDLEIQTNRSTIRNFFRMSYKEMDDLDDFLHAVKLQGDFNNSYISSDDIAFFAPALRSWKKDFQLTGKVQGTIGALKGSNLNVKTGIGTLLDGDISLTGLPDINETFIDLKANDLRTTYGDALTVIPALRQITKPDLRKLQDISFKGNFTGFIKDFVTFGTIRTNLGTVSTDLNMKFPDGKEPVYSGTIETKNFNLGVLLENKQLGATAFNIKVLGRGFSSGKRNTSIDGDIDFVDFNGYRYQHIKAKGNLDKNLFAGIVSIKDQNIAFQNLTGAIDFNEQIPVFKLKGNVETLNLKNLGITKDEINFDGKLDLNFSGNNIDNFLGTAKISAATLTRDGRQLPFDTLVIATTGTGLNKKMSIASNEFKADINGSYKLNELADGFSWMLHKYFPSYFKAPAVVPQNQEINFDITTYYFEDYAQLIHPKLGGFNNSRFQGYLNPGQNKFYMLDSIPQFSWGKYSFDEVRLDAKGENNRLALNGEARNFRLNDSLNFPLVTFNINSGNDSSHISLQTGATQALEKANINAWVLTGKDSISIDFEPSEFTVNGKQWTIDQEGRMTFSKGNPVSGSVILSEGDEKLGKQKIVFKTIPSGETGKNNLQAVLSNVNLGDIGPYLLPKNRLVGTISGTVIAENFTDDLHIYSNDLLTKDLQLDNDSLGAVKTSVDFNKKTNELVFKGNTLNQENYLGFDGKVIIGDHEKAKNNNLISLKAKRFQIKVLERFLGNLFSDIQGYLTGDISLKGEFDDLAINGKGKLFDAGMRVNFTQCYYRIKDTTIKITPEEINFNGIVLTDTVTKNPVYVRGGIEHQSFKNMFYNMDVTTQKPNSPGRENNKPVLLLNTTIKDNKQFYGRVFGTGSFSLLGPQSEMFMDIDAVGQAFGKDSSHIVIPPSSTRESGSADFLVERKFGREMADIDAPLNATNIIYNVKVTATPAVNLEVQIDELTGDIIKGRGKGTLNIISGTAEPLQMRGRFDIDEGNYLFTFQSYFKKPFELRKGSDNYIEWNGDPYDANINLTAVYTASRVSYAPLKSTLVALDNKVANAYSDVYVVAKLTEHLFSPKIEFGLDFPTTSAAVNDPGLAFGLQQLQKNANELQKQATYLVVFGSFAPVELTAKSSIQEITNSLSGIFFGVINDQIKKVITGIFNSPKYTVNFNSSIYNRNVLDQDVGLNIGSDLNLSIGRSFLNDRIIISMGGTVEGLSLGQTSSIQQEAQGLFNANVEILLNPSGTFRANLFFRQNTDFLTTTSSGPGRANKWGAGVAYRKDADKFWRLFFKKRAKKSAKKPENLPIENLDIKN
ncbi:MAG: hypothetical protein V9F46_15025 [Chitinophagaceae bacterium]